MVDHIYHMSYLKKIVIFIFHLFNKLKIFFEKKLRI
jgi:hypothetical protein